MDYEYTVVCSHDACITDANGYVQVIMTNTQHIHIYTSSNRSHCEKEEGPELDGLKIIWHANWSFCTLILIHFGQ